MPLAAMLFRTGSLVVRPAYLEIFPSFRIKGVVYHRIGSLFPDQGQPYTQLYISDTERGKKAEPILEISSRNPWCFYRQLSTTAIPPFGSVQACSSSSAECYLSA